MQKMPARKLPIIDIEDGAFKATFTVEVRLNQIRDANPPYQAISFTQMDYAPNYEDFVFLLDKDTGQQYHPEKGVHSLPRNVIAVQIPNQRELDPEGMRLHHGGWSNWLSEYQQKETHKARILPVSKLGYAHTKNRVVKRDEKNIGNVKKKK